MAAYSQDDIAIVGISCRFPGEAKSPEAFYELLKNGRDCWRKIPKERFDIDQYWHPSHERQGSIVCQGGYFLEEDPAHFDAPFFSMTAAEANAMDPQQRFLLESTFEATESAGIPMHKLVGSETSVYVGCFTHDYESIASHQINDTLLYQGTGQGLAMLSNRLSYFFSLNSVSLTLDTACSSSLLALHLACQSIRTGESKMSIVAGIGLILAPDMLSILTSLHFLSPDSKCWSFDDRANGYARGEGFSTMILKPVADAIRDGDTIRAVIRATGSNQDGRTTGITLPNSEAQGRLIAETYRNAGLPLKETQYFEAHGTGTPAGDPLELGALGVTFGADATREQPLYVGSVKTNIGHLEGCAGLAGLMKAILSVESGLIFPSLNFENPNPRLKLDEWNLKIVTELMPWPTTGRRRVSVNSFGYGGSNVHCVIEDAHHYLAERGLQGFHNTNPEVPVLPQRVIQESDGKTSIVEHIEVVNKDTAETTVVAKAPVLDKITESGNDSGIGSDASSADSDEDADILKYNPVHRKKLFVLSARDEVSLGRMKSSWSKYVEAKKKSTKKIGGFLDSLAFTLGARRSIFPWKMAVVGSSAKEISSAMHNGQSTRSKKAIRIAFVFTGQGAQWYAQGRSLMEHQVYAESIRQADAFLSALGSPWSVIEALYASEESSRINEPEFSQPLCTILQIALVDLLAHWNVKMSAVVGHSSGEIAAAYAAGALSAEDAWTIAYHRGQFTKRIAAVCPKLKGGMLAVGLSEEKTKSYLDALKTTGIAVVACVNSPASVTVSGDNSALDELDAQLVEDGIFSRKLKVPNAYHSPHMQVVAGNYQKAIAHITPRAIEPGCTFYSSVTAAASDGTDLDSAYWTSNMVSPVRFAQAIDLLFPDPKANRRQRQKGHAINTLIEVGPSGALLGPLRDIISCKDNKDDITLLSVLTRGRDAIETALTMAGKLWTLGYADIDLNKVNNCSINYPSQAVLCDAPTYPWNHNTRYWHEPQTSRNHRQPRAPRLDVLGAPTVEWNPSQPVWHNRLKVGELPYLKEHQVLSTIIFPAAGYICAVLEAARQVADPAKVVKSFELRDVIVGRALVLDGDTDVAHLVTTLKPRKMGLKGRDAPWTEFTLYSDGDKGHIEHCSGLLYTHYEHDSSEIEGGHEERYRHQKLREEYLNIKSTSNKEVTPGEMYAILESIGLQYGPLFRGITKIRSGAKGAGCSEITVSDTKAVMPCQFEYDHLLHPCTLDACFQSIFVAFVGGKASGKALQAMVPTSIDKLVISAVQPKGAGAKYYGFAQGAKRGFREAVGRFCMSDEEFSTPFIEVEGFSCTELGALTGGQVTSQNERAALRKVQFDWRWAADPFLFTEDIAKDLIMMPKEEYEANKDLWHKSTIDLEKLCAIFGKRAIKSLTQETEDKLPPHLKLYVHWLKEHNKLAQQGALALQNGSNAWVNMTTEEEDKFIADNADTSVDTRFGIAVGKALPQILDGSVQALSVMLEDNLLMAIYGESLSMSMSIHQFERFFSYYGHKQPAMRILEVGAGSASTTETVLRGLSNHQGSTVRCSSYVFTDVSTGFFEGAEKRLRKWANVVSYKRLNIEEDPIDQGFEAASFDVIVASNVLHATKSLDVTMSNVHKLLKPGGHLLLAEITQMAPRSSLVYGTLEGWWLSEDERKGALGGPCITPQEWSTIFERNSFVENYRIPDVSDNNIHFMSLFCATKKAKLDLPMADILLIHDGTASTTFLDKLTGELTKFDLPIGKCTTDELISKVGHVDASEKTSTPAANPLNSTLVISLLEVEKPYTFNLDADRLKVVQNILTKPAVTLWITRGDVLGQCDPNFRLIDGVIRTIRNEDNSLKIYQLDFDKSLHLDSTEASNCVSTLLEDIFSAGPGFAETETAYKDGKYMIPRIYEDVPKNFDLRMLHDVRPPEMQPLHQKDRHLMMTIGVPGMLDTLHFIDDKEMLKSMIPDGVRVRVMSTAMNFVDIMIAMGIVPEESLGADAAGIVTEVGSAVTKLAPGDRVACLHLGAYRNTLSSHQLLVHKIPDDLPFDEASTILTVFVTAYQSLIEIGKLQAGETVLIHAAAGGLGQAAIQLAQNIGATIYVTVGSMAKKKLVMDLYNIPEENIFNSRDLTFADAVLRATDGKGVDVVLNSLAGEALRKTWTCVKDFGRFIEVGKKDILTNSGLEMMPFLRNITFAGVNVEHLIRQSYEKGSYLAEKVMELLHAGKIRPVSPITRFSMADMEKAFRTMQQGKHTGKIVLTMEDEDIQVPVVPRDEHPLKLRADRTYLLVGGLGGLGRSQAIWLAENGAKYLAFISRSGAASEAAQKTLQELLALGVKSVAYPCDCADEDALAATLAQMANDLPPISGVIQGAMVLSDAFFSNMKIEQWNTAIKPKVQGSWNLHNLLPRDMDFFIMLSSLTGVVGSRGQSNYAAGNTWQDALAWHRHRQGLPATALDLGIMTGMGYVEDHRDSVGMNHLSEHLKTVGVEPEEFYSILKSAITGYTDGYARTPVQASIGPGTGGMINASQMAANYDFYWHDDIKFSYLRHVDTLDNAAISGEGESELRAAITSASSFAEAIDIIQTAMVAKLSKAMMIPPEDIDVSKPISVFGVDSLVAVEVRNWVTREAKSDLSVFDILSPIPMSQLLVKLALKSTLIPAELKAEAGEMGGEDAATAINAAEANKDATDDAAVSAVLDGEVPTNTTVVDEKEEL